MHKWIGTYNLNLMCINRFFKWLFSPNLEPKQRPKPQRSVDVQVADYDNNHSLILLLSKSNFFSYDSLDGGSSRVTGPSSL
jgi:hypothetical protein